MIEQRKINFIPQLFEPVKHPVYCLYKFFDLLEKDSDDEFSQSEDFPADMDEVMQPQQKQVMQSSDPAFHLKELEPTKDLTKRDTRR